MIDAPDLAEQPFHPVALNRVPDLAADRHPETAWAVLSLEEHHEVSEMNLAASLLNAQELATLAQATRSGEPLGSTHHGWSPSITSWASTTKDAPDPCAGGDEAPRGRPWFASAFESREPGFASCCAADRSASLFHSIRTDVLGPIKKRAFDNSVRPPCQRVGEETQRDGLKDEQANKQHSCGPTRGAVKGYLLWRSKYLDGSVQVFFSKTIFLFYSCFSTARCLDRRDVGGRASFFFHRFTQMSIRSTFALALTLAALLPSCFALLTAVSKLLGE